MARPAFPETPIFGDERVLTVRECIDSVSKAHRRVNDAWLKTIPNLTGPISLFLSVETSASDWQVRIGENQLSGETPVFIPTRGQRRNPLREFTFSSALGLHTVSSSRRRQTRGDNGERNVSGSNKLSALQLANEDLGRLLQPAEEAAEKTPVTVFAIQKPRIEESLDAQLQGAPQETLATLLKPIPNLEKAVFPLRDSLGQVWILTASRTFVGATRSTPAGTELESFFIRPSPYASERYIVYNVRRKSVGREGSPDVAKKALDRLAELLAPTKKIKEQ